MNFAITVSYAYFQQPNVLLLLANQAEHFYSAFVFCTYQKERLSSRRNKAIQEIYNLVFCTTIGTVVDSKHPPVIGGTFFLQKCLKKSPHGMKEIWPYGNERYYCTYYRQKYTRD